MAKKKIASTELEPITTTATEAPPAIEAPKPASKKKRREPPPIATLETASEGFLGSMESNGNSRGTIASYGAELKLAQSEIGAETPVAEITPEMITTYFESPRVTLLRSGKPKSQLSIDKTRRVLRLAIDWATREGWIEKSPVPKTRANDEPAPTPKAKRTKGVTVIANDAVVSNSETAA